MSTLRVALVGTGRAASALAPFLKTPPASLVAVVGRSRERARSLAEAVGAPAALTLEDAPPPCDWWLVAVRDDAIAEVDARLGESGAYAGARVAAHLSGALPGRTLARAAAAGLSVASVHPLAPLADARGNPPSFFTLEGDRAALDLVAPWIDAIGARHVRIASESQPLYHAAAAMAGNFVVSLLAAASETGARAGLPDAEGERALAELGREALRNVGRLGAGEALTGPIRRGDVGTVRAHLREIAVHLPHLLPLYATLGLETARLARRAKEPPPEASLDAVEGELRRALAAAASSIVRGEAP